MQTAITLSKLGISPVIIEREETIGGKLNRWDRLFPVLSRPRIGIIVSQNDYECKTQVPHANILYSTSVRMVNASGRL